MKIKFENKTVYVYKEDEDPKFYNESRLLHHIKLELIKMGYDVIKKLAYKDGNMVDENMYYIRDRKYRFYIHDPNYSIRNCYEDFNNGLLKLDFTSNLEE